MAKLKNRNLKPNSIRWVYWFLLIYIIAALIWWFIELQSQNNEILKIRIAELDSNHPAYQQELKKIQNFWQRELRKFTLEGLTFLALILLGAFYVYRAVRNQMRLQQQEQNFLMAVTHELKTPIAVAQLNLETLLKRQLAQDQQRNMFSKTLQEIKRLDTLASNILMSAQLEGGRYRKESEELDFSLLVQTCCNEFSQRFSDREIRSGIESGLETKGDPLLLEILVNNLIENALKYSPKKAPVTCSLRAKGKNLQLSVADEGCGIDQKERKKVFVKFYRVGNENTRSARGTGLGLYLCQKIVTDHQGIITIAGNHPQGTIFIVELPRTN